MLILPVKRVVETSLLSSKNKTKSYCINFCCFTFSRSFSVAALLLVFVVVASAS